MQRPKIIAIEWEDPNSSDGWTNPKDVTKMTPAIVVSVGMLVNEDEDWLWICMDWAKDGDVNTIGRIRQALIKKRKEVNLPRGIWTELKPTPKQIETAPEIVAQPVIV